MDFSHNHKGTPFGRGAHGQRRTGKAKNGGHSMELIHLGGEKTVTGSCHLLRINGVNILVDCGLCQGGDRVVPMAEWPVPPDEIDFLFLTHLSWGEPVIFWGRPGCGFREIVRRLSFPAILVVTRPRFCRIPIFRSLVICWLWSQLMVIGRMVTGSFGLSV